MVFWPAGRRERAWMFLTRNHPNSIMSLLVQASLECTHMHVNFGLYAHTLCANFGLNEHTLYANFGLYAHTLCAIFPKWTHTVCKFRLICTQTLCIFLFKWSQTLCKFCGTTNLFSGHLRAPIEDIHTFSNFSHKIIELLILCAFKSIFAHSVCVHLSTSFFIRRVSLKVYFLGTYRVPTLLVNTMIPWLLMIIVVMAMFDHHDDDDSDEWQLCQTTLTPVTRLH